MIRALVDLLVGPIGTVLAGALGLAAAWFFGSRAGRQKERSKQLERRVETMHEADRIEDAVAGRSEAEVKEELRRW